MNNADYKLKKSGVGSIYKDKFEHTMAQTLVNLRIVIGNDEKPIPVIGFDIAAAIQEKKDESDKTKAGLSVQFLSVIGINAGIEEQSGQTHTSSNTHRITFSVPV